MNDDVLALWEVDTVDMGRREFGTLADGPAALPVHATRRAKRRA